MSDRGNLKERLQKGETVIGPFVIVASPIMIEAAGLAGMDFVVFDTEHGPLDVGDLDHLVPVARQAGLAPVVRVGEINEWQIVRALDVGADAVQVPQITDRASAEAVVGAAKYAPLGQRGMSPVTRAGALHTRGPGYYEAANAETALVVHIEGVEGVRNLDEVLAVEQIDVVFLGPYDLSQSLGIPGQVDDPRVQDAVRDCVKRINAAGKVAGSFAKDVPTAARWMDIGIRYVSYQVDALIYQQACCEILRQLR